MFSLIPWRRRVAQPAQWRGFADPFKDVDAMMERFFGNSGMEPGKAFTRPFTPAMDIAEDDDKYVVTAEVPGMDAEGLDVTLTDGVLTIKGEKSDEKEDKTGNYHRVERTFGSFCRSVALPSEVQADKVEAEYKDGVLTLTLPKSEETKEKSVKISVH